MKLALLWWFAALLAFGEGVRDFPRGICAPLPKVHYNTVTEDQQTILDELVAVARTRASDGGGDGRVIVLMFADSAYQHVVVNWLYAAAASNVSNSLVVSLDPGLHRTLQRLGAPSFYHPAAVETMSRVFLANTTASARSAALAKVWGYRLLAIEALLASGLTVLQTDSDVVLFPNAVREITALPGDVVVQPGGMPASVASGWGVALCLGLILFRANARTVLLLRVARAFFAHAEYDDQIAFNYALKTCTQMVFKSQAWDSAGPLLFGKRVKTALKTEPVFAYARKSQNAVLSGALTVTFMPAVLAPRRDGPCGLAAGKKGMTIEQRMARFDAALAETPHSVAFHCNSATGKSKQSVKRLKVSGLYYVSERKLWTFENKMEEEAKAGQEAKGDGRGAAGTSAVYLGSAAEAKRLVLCMGNGRHPGALPAGACSPPPPA